MSICVKSYLPTHTYTHRAHTNPPDVLNDQIQPRPRRRGGRGDAGGGAEARVADVAREQVQARGEEDELFLCGWWCLWCVYVSMCSRNVHKRRNTPNSKIE